MAPTTVRPCGTCGEVTDCYRTICRPCRAARMRAYRRRRPDVIKAVARSYYERNREDVKTKSHAWRQANLEHAQQRDRAYFAAGRRDPVAAARRNAAWYAANKVRLVQVRAAWRQKNREKAVLYAQRHRALRLGLPNYTVTDRDWRRLVARHGGRCAYCRGPGPLEQDHVIPLSRGGKHGIGNLLPACRSCNAKKHAHLLAEWRYA